MALGVDLTRLLYVTDSVEAMLLVESVRRAVGIAEDRDEALAVRIINRLAESMK